MVAAIVIPIIILYFLWVTIKDAKENEIKWLQSGTAREEAVITGTVSSVFHEKQRFYYHRYIFVQELVLKTDNGGIKARINTPLTRDAKIKEYQPGQNLRIYGSFENNSFHANRIEII